MEGKIVKADYIIDNLTSRIAQLTKESAFQAAVITEMQNELNELKRKYEKQLEAK